MPLDQSHIKSISSKVHRRFPELRNVLPVVRSQSTPKSRPSGNGRASKSRNRFLLTFRGTAALPGGKTMQRVVRVIANEKGKVIKMALSK